MSQATLQAAFKAAFLAVPGLVADPVGVDPLMQALAAALWPYLSMVAGANIYLTPEGGVAAKIINGTGSVSVKGTVVSASTTAGAFISQANQYDAIGVVYETGVANGAACWVVFSGIAEVLFEDGIAPVAGYWVQAAVTDGRATNLAQPSGGGFPNAQEHFKEIGHCLESKSAGTDVLAKCMVHFN